MPISRISAKVILVGRAGAMMPPLFVTIGPEGKPPPVRQSEKFPNGFNCV